MELAREHDLQPGTCVGCTVGEVPHVSELRFLDERLVGCVAAVARTSTSAHQIMSHYLTCKQADPSLSGLFVLPHLQRAYQPLLRGMVRVAKVPAANWFPSDDTVPAAT